MKHWWSIRCSSCSNDFPTLPQPDIAQRRPLLSQGMFRAAVGSCIEAQTSSRPLPAATGPELPLSRQIVSSTILCCELAGHLQTTGRSLQHVQECSCPAHQRIICMSSGKLKAVAYWLAIFITECDAAQSSQLRSHCLTAQTLHAIL